MLIARLQCSNFDHRRYFFPIPMDYVPLHPFMLDAEQEATLLLFATFASDWRVM